MELTRAVYSLGRRKTASVALDSARSLIDTQLQSFEQGIVTQEEFSLEVVGSSRASVSCSGQTYAAYLLDYTGVSGVLTQGPWIYAGKGRCSDFRRLRGEGKIVIVESDLCNHRYLQIQRASQAGAQGVVIISKSTTSCEYGTGASATDSPVEIPAVSLAGQDARQLMQKAGEVRIDFSHRMERALGHNLILELPGACTDRFIVIGAHYDSWTCGAQDNVAALLIMLRLLERVSQRTGPYGYRFVFFDAEELGLCGSRYHVEHNDLQTVVAYLNLDAVVPSVSRKLKCLFHSSSMRPYLSRIQSLRAGFWPLSLNWFYRSDKTLFPSDVHHFHRHDVPCLTTYCYGDFFHTDEDVWENTAFDQIDRTLAVIWDVIERIERA